MMSFYEIFEKALINAEIEKQNKNKKYKAMRAYREELIKQGIDKEVADVMSKTFFDYGLIKPAV